MTKEQFSELVSQYERLVYTVCFQLVRDAAAAEDLTQETFLSAWLHRDTVPAGGKVPGRGGPGPGQAGKDGTYTALPGQTAAAGKIGKERRIWNGSALTDI